MNLDPYAVRIFRVLVVAFAFVFIMYVAAEVLKPLALAILLSFILAPLVQWAVRRGLPRSSSVALVLILVFTVVGGVTYVVGDQFASLADQLPTYQANIQKKLVALRPQNDSALDKARRAVSSIERSLRPAEADYATPVRVVSENATVCATAKPVRAISCHTCFWRRGSSPARLRTDREQ